MATREENQRLSAIRRRHGDASSDWQLGENGIELHAVFMPNTPPVCIAHLTADCGIPDRDFLLNAKADEAFRLRMFDAACAEILKWKPTDRKREQQARDSGNFAAECGIKCKDATFRRFLFEEKKMDVADDRRVEASVRFLLKVDSRGELNNDAGARNRWFDLRAEFENWRRTA